MLVIRFDGGISPESTSAIIQSGILFDVNQFERVDPCGDEGGDHPWPLIGPRYLTWPLIGLSPAPGLAVAPCLAASQSQC